MEVLLPPLMEVLLPPLVFVGPLLAPEERTLLPPEDVPPSRGLSLALDYFLVVLRTAGGG